MMIFFMNVGFDFSVTVLERIPLGMRSSVENDVPSLKSFPHPVRGASGGHCRNDRCQNKGASLTGCGLIYKGGYVLPSDASLTGCKIKTSVQIYINVDFKSFQRG